MNETPLAPFVGSPRSAGIFLDFDGTLSEIVEIPSDARPMAEVNKLLGDLADRYGVVAVVSGRSAHELMSWLGTEVELWGVHGAQHAIGGEVTYTDEARPHQELIALVKAEADGVVADAGLPGVIVEDKGIAIGLHWRGAVDKDRAKAALDSLADTLSRKHGLSRGYGRFVFELFPPIEFSKATVVLDRTRQEGLKAAMFVGDDRVDLAAFDALDVLAGEGVATVRVAVSSDEAPAELIERADLVVDGPRGVVSLLKGLVTD